MSASECTTPVLFYERKFYAGSNFSAFAVELWGKLWPTSEHAYQASKFVHWYHKNLIRHARSPHDAKLLAQQMREHQRGDFDVETKLAIMEMICRAKLNQHEEVRKQLLATGEREIIENSPVDSFWGWGPDKKGLNHLGKIWMKLRAELQEMSV